MKSDNMDSKFKRNATIDVAKGIAIIGVVYIHFATISLNKDWITYAFIDTFRIGVPIFIYLFSYFLEKSISKKENVFRFLALRGCQLFYQFIFWSAIYYLINKGWDGESIAKQVTKYWTGYGWSGQYFYLILIQAIILFPILRKQPLLILKISITLLFLVYVILTYFNSLTPEIISKTGYRPIIYWIPCIALGIFHAQNENHKLNNWFLFLIILIPIELCIIRLKNIAYIDYLCPSILISSIVLPAITNNKNSYPKTYFPKKIIAQIGSNSLGIFVLNPLIIHWIHKSPLFLNFNNTALHNLYIIITSAIITFLCYYITVIMKKTFLEIFFN